MNVKGKIFLVQWDADAAASRACDLRADGWYVDVEAEDGGQAFRLIRVEQPDVVVIDLVHKPAHGREVARALREVTSLVDLPIVFVDGDEKTVEKVHAKVAGAVFTSSTRLKSALAQYAATGNG